MLEYIGIIVFSIIGSWLGVRLSYKFNLLDTPGKDLDRSYSVPTLQGVVFFILFVSIVSLFFPEYYQYSEFLALILGGVLILIYTVWDDLHNIKCVKGFTKGLNPKFRFVLQVIIAIIAFSLGGVYIEEFVWVNDMVIKFPIWLSLIFTVIWFGGFINAVNWFDGINGQASGVASIGFITIALLIKFVVFQIYEVTGSHLALLDMTLNLSIVLAILSIIYSIIEYKPTGLLRDAGIMFMGFALGYLALLGGAKIGTIFVALSLVIFDSVWVFINRLLEGRNPFKKDYTHLHYRLMALGWKRMEIKWFVWVWSIFAMVLMILQQANRLSKIVIFIMMALIFFGTNIYLFWIKDLPDRFKP